MMLLTFIVGTFYSYKIIVVGEYQIVPIIVANIILGSTLFIVLLYTGSFRLTNNELISLLSGSVLSIKTRKA